MSKKITSFLYVVLLLSIASCASKDSYQVANNGVKVNMVSPEESSVQGVLRVKLKETSAQMFVDVINQDGLLTKSGDAVADAAFSKIGATKVTQVFPTPERFKKRHHEAGLHLWYDVYFDSKNTLTKASHEIEEIEGVDIIESIPKEVISKYTITPYVESNSSAVKNNAVFNDPGLDKQWHYYNDGSLGEAYINGCDINVLPVWKQYSTGSDKVIVCVVDGGIDHSHPDINSNMWKNLAEFNGLPNVDDDKNGYVDDIYGADFVAGNLFITPDSHGTHVGGTISAVNNNGIGVCGVAGGDYANGVAGVKVMSAQIFINKDSGNSSAAIVYGADNGAVISQNSWSMPDATSLPTYTKEAIDYFIKNAGYDENGEQEGPMAGGVVFFSAGNYNKETGIPAQYEKVVSVSALSGDYVMSYYSNFGNWVSITAPGGDYRKGPLILSLAPDGEYAYMQGTSMSCPHISGIAALILSKYGKIGFTNEDLKNALLSSSRNIDKYNVAFTGRVGGLVDTYGAFLSFIKGNPNPVKDVKLMTFSNDITVAFTIPSEEGGVGGNRMKEFNIYFDTKPINSLSPIVVVKPDQVVTGEVISKKINRLEFEKKYYVGIETVDYGNNKSSMVLSEIVTGPNHAPIIKPKTESSVHIKAYQSIYLDFIITEPDAHSFTAKVTESPISTMVEAGDSWRIVFNGKKAESGLSGALNLTATDEYGLFSSFKIPFVVDPNNPPVVIKDGENIVVNETKKLDLSTFIIDKDGESLQYSIESDDKDNIFNYQIKENSLTIIPKKYGVANIKIVGKDAFDQKKSIAFTLLSRDASKDYDIYPNPVVSTLNIRVGEVSDCKITISNAVGTVVYSAQHEINPFSPLQIDMNSMPAGNYSVSIDNGKSNVINNIVKL